MQKSYTFYSSNSEPINKKRNKMSLLNTLKEAMDTLQYEINWIITHDPTEKNKEIVSKLREAVSLLLSAYEIAEKEGDNK